MPIGRMNIFGFCYKYTHPCKLFTYNPLFHFSTLQQQNTTYTPHTQPLTKSYFHAVSKIPQQKKFLISNP